MKKGKVFFKDKECGVLEEIPGGGTRFTYAEEWNEVTIACVLPVHKRRIEWERGLHPFFQHLCPEGWLREKQARGGGIQPEDDFGLLLRFGGDCIGAIGIYDLEGKHLPDISNRDIETRSALDGRTISGVQRKLLAYWSETDNAYYPSIENTPATYIAKLNSLDIDTLVQNERLSLQLAQDVLGKTHVTQFEPGILKELNEVALFVKRFDRKLDGSKLRMEEFAQILNKPRGTDYQGKYEGSYEEIAAAIKEYSVLPVIDLNLFFRQVVFSAIIGNCDAHLKNFALLETSKGLRLAPAYDLLNTLVYSHKNYDTRIALSLCGQKPYLESIDRKILAELGHRIGLTEKAVTLVFKDIKEKIRKTQRLDTHPANGPEHFTNRYKEIVEAACLRILEE